MSNLSPEEMTAHSGQARGAKAMTDKKMSAEELASKEGYAKQALGWRSEGQLHGEADRFYQRMTNLAGDSLQFLAHIAALEADLATSERARGKREGELKTALEFQKIQAEGNRLLREEAERLREALEEIANMKAAYGSVRSVARQALKEVER